MVRVALSKSRLSDAKTDLVAVGVFQDVDVSRQPEVKRVDDALSGLVGRLVASKEFKAKANAARVVYASGDEGPARVLLVGLGAKDAADLDRVREYAAKVALTARSLGLKDAAAAPPTLDRAHGGAADLGQAFAEGAVMGLFDYRDYKSTAAGDDDVPETDLEAIYLLEPRQARHGPLMRGMARGVHLAEATNLARSLILRPSKDKPPAVLAKLAQAEARKAKVTCRVFTPVELEQLGMGALLGVGSGSTHPPRMVVLEYRGGGTKKVLLCGKGITFDSGGLNIKTGSHMDRMKYDMAGSATVLAATLAAARLQLPVNLVAIMALAENMPSGSAIRPGDVLTAYNKTTIEIGNTDAEGRLVLADALSYGVDKHKPDLVVDVATLTGAARIALGNVTTAILGNDDALVRRLIDAGRRTGDRLWQLPLGDEYARQIKSDIADVRNMGMGSAGTITAAQFLQKFVDGAAWAHLDIAGTCWTEKGGGDLQKEYLPKGPTGIGVRLLVEWMGRL